MYPFNAVLVGCDDDLLLQLGPELLAMDARIEAEFLGVESAIEGLRNPTPAEDREAKPAWGTRRPEDASHLPRRDPGARHLFILRLDPPHDLTPLKRLSSMFAGQPIIALLDAQNNASLPIAAMRAGATQVVLLPIQPDDFRAALDAIALQSGHVAADGQVLAIAGVTGGCGATTIAINLAYELAYTRRLRVILAELSLQVGKLPVYLDVEPKHTIHDLLADIKRLDLYLVQQALTPVADRFTVLTGPYEAVHPLAVSSADLMYLIDLLRQLADVIVLDVPCTYDAQYFDMLAAADKVVLVAEQKVPSIRSLQMISTNLAHKQPHLLLNRYDPNIKGFGAARLQEMLRGPKLLTIANDYESVSTAVNHGKPLRVEAPQSRALADIVQVAQTLVPQQGAAAPDRKAGLSGVIRGLARAFGRSGSR